MSVPELKGTPARGLLGTTIGFFFGFAAVSLYGPTAIKFREAMELTPAMVGLLVAIPSLTGSLLRIPFGAWVDTAGGRKPFLILLILSAIGLGGITLLLKLEYPSEMEDLYPLILFLGMLSGCGIATFSVGIGQTSYWYPFKKQGRALGTYAGIGNLAPGLFSIILPLYLQRYGFISAYFAWFLFLLAGIAVYWATGVNSYYFQLRQTGLSAQESRFKARQMGQELFPAGNIKEVLVNSARTFNTWKLVLLYFTTFGGFIALTAWFPVYWAGFHGYNTVKAGLYTAVFSLLSSLLRVAGGAVADRAGGIRTSVISLVIVLISSIVLIFIPYNGLEMAAVFMLAAGMGMNNAAVFKLVPRCVPSAIGGAAGWIGGIGAFGGFVIPPLLGLFVSISGLHGYSTGFAVFSLLSVVSLVIILGMKKDLGANA
ncbi:MAG TPA: MFS transporter [Bacteroidales bacterium]|nr:MFS transporter [Bacteroidales bacterium]